MSEEQDIRQIELFCKQLYESQDPLIRSQAEKAVLTFQESPDTLSKCQALLDRADSSYAQLLAATTLSKLVSRPSQALSLQQRLDIRNYVLNYLATRHKLEMFVVQALVSLFARITKLGWFDTLKDDYVFRNVMIDIANFLQIFRVSCSLLNTARSESFVGDDMKHSLMVALLKLAHNCLTFDFIGTSNDETCDDQCTVQIPANWRPTFLEMSTLDLFFELAATTTLSSLALSCLVQLASVRRSLFNNIERAKFLNRLVTGVTNILVTTQGLSDPNNYHEFCRLLSRLKSNYQLGELVTVDNYPQFIQLIAKFTVQSLRLWQFTNSVHYVLSLWQRMVVSIPYVKNSPPHLLETYAPEVMTAYIMSRLDSVALVLREEIEDPLDDMGIVHQQLEQLSVIGRCEYAKTCSLLVAHFDTTAATYNERRGQPDTALLQGQLTWLVYIIGAAIGGRANANSSDECDSMDGELVCRVLQLMDLTDVQLVQGNGCEKLELAMLWFLEQFRKMYVTDNVHKNSKLYRRLADVLAIGDETMLLSVFMRKIITNLKYLGGSEQIISKSLSLLSDLSGGYSCVRKLVKLDETQLMLTHHTAEHFPFLGTNVSLSEMRRRSMLYTALGRLLMVELGEDEDKFHQFMMPLTAAFESVRGILGPTGGTGMYEEDTKKTLIGLARDLRGLAFAFNTKTTYIMLFNWIYPVYLSLLIRGVELWYTAPAVTTPILKLMAELAQNRNQRLMFDVSSPNGYLLFREVSNIISTYGSRILTVETDKKNQYTHKLKGISLCFTMLKAALCGNYANFGVFRLYGDKALDNALNMFIKLLLSIPQSDLQDYPKLSQTYYVLLERLAQDHTPYLASLDQSAFLYILATISEGLTALDSTICTGCCATLDEIVTYLFKQLMLKQNNKLLPGQLENNMFIVLLQSRPEILQQLLATVLNIIIFEECCNQWSMSRPLLGLVLLNEEYFNRLREQTVNSQPPHMRTHVAHFFNSLMDGIERNLYTKNRDRFTQNLSTFRRDISDSLKGPGGGGVATSCVNDMMTT